MAQDRFASYDAAYVLGALSPKDRQEYEQHLRECPDCATAVRELAGMPGLLSRVPPSLLPTEEELPDPPADLLPKLLNRVRAERLRRRVITIGTATLAAAACLVLVFMIVFRPLVGDQPAAIPSATMSPVSNAPVWASIGLKEVDWGTKIDMHCMYEQRPGSTRSGVYLLVVVTKQGVAETISTWKVFPGKDARFQAATSHSINEIAAIEVRSSSNKTLLTISP
ncbi:anti-sigma factor family protein [Microlunatus speluncae]|uniref:anti-sigma factor family protein n=1 Tax=Microlunatus speluncae TaxID=2594267 RepID=UPI0012666D1A|nr:zf-HC2 domain-containing protein [Microlunatus speluncae]